MQAVNGHGPYQYVIQQQVEQAKRLLKQRDGAVASVAYECGFKSQSHLSRHFRQLTGVTPQKYQQQ
ncbi:MAG: AraC family transcriptional regulator [Cyanobacteria bacterium QS_9_48_30]|nr:MAG: AraC family transcriptional regulator [Cyanobacteria bacterium QS_9_48_30]